MIQNIILLKKMVLDIYVKGCKYSISCGYSDFSLFRCEILRIWNQELGKLYKQQHYSFLEDSVVN